MKKVNLVLFATSLMASAIVHAGGGGGSPETYMFQCANAEQSARVSLVQDHDIFVSSYAEVTRPGDASPIIVRYDDFSEDLELRTSTFNFGAKKPTAPQVKLIYPFIVAGTSVVPFRGATNVTVTLDGEKLKCTGKGIL